MNMIRLIHSILTAVTLAHKEGFDVTGKDGLTDWGKVSEEIDLQSWAADVSGYQPLAWDDNDKELWNAALEACKAQTRYMRAVAV